MATLRQRTSFGPGIYRGHQFSIDRLRSFVEGTNAAIAAGVPIPLLKRHAPINASDSDTVQFAKEEGSGWVKKVELEPDGSIAWEADNVPDDVAKNISLGTIKFTSPEFRPHYEAEKAGVYRGPVIRHFAFTPTPGNPHQGNIEVVNESVALSECIQLSEADYMGPVEQFGEGVEDEGTWNKAKKAVGKEGDKYKGDTYWAVVSSVYKKMGGKYKKSSQHAELYPVEAPSINAIADSIYKDFQVKYPKHNEDAEDDEENGTEDFGKSEGESVDDEELVNGETKPKKKKGTKNDNDLDDVEHEQEMDKESNEAADTQHSETVEGEYRGASYHAKQFQDLVHKHGGDSEVYTGAGRAIGKKFKLPKSSVSEFHKSVAKDIPHYKEGSHYTVGSSQHAEKDSDGFGKPENDLPNNPTKQSPTDINLEVNENLEAPKEVEPPKNPDMPPKATDKTKLAAIIAGFNQLNIVVPSDWDPCKDGAMDILLGCLNTHIKTEQDAEVKESAEQEDVEDPKDAPMPFSEMNHHDLLTHHGWRKEIGGGYTHKDHPGSVILADSKDWLHSPASSKKKPKKGVGNDSLALHLTHLDYKNKNSQHGEEEDTTQFTEEELQALTPKARAVIEAGQKALQVEREAKEKAQREAIAFAEQEKSTRNMAAKGKAIAEVTACIIPPSLKRKLLSDYQTVQFTEGTDQPLYTAEQVAKMVANSIPPSLQFLEEQTKEGTKPTVSVMVGKNADGSPIYRNVEDAEQFFEKDNITTMTADRANEIANATVGAQVFHHRGTPTFSPTVPISERVTAENLRVPNNVLNR